MSAARWLLCVKWILYYFRIRHPETSGLYTRQQNLSPSYKKTLNKDQLSEKDAVESFWLYNVHIVKGRGGEMASYYRVLYRGGGEQAHFPLSGCNRGYASTSIAYRLELKGRILLFVWEHLYLVLVNRAWGLYGRILTEVANTDRTQCRAVRSVPASEVKILP